MNFFSSFMNISVSVITFFFPELFLSHQKIFLYVISKYTNFILLIFIVEFNCIKINSVFEFHLFNHLLNYFKVSGYESLCKFP